MLPSEGKFFEFFISASENLLCGASLLKKLLDDFHDVDEVLAQMTEIEHQGDFILHEVTNLLPRTLITPLDSQDIQNLIVAVDDALDAIHAATTRISIYRVTEIKKPARRLGQLILEGATQLDQVVRCLEDKKSYNQIRERIVQINTIENNGDRVLEDGLRNLVDHRDDIFEFIRWKEIYELLEQATDRLEDAADVIQKVIITNA